MGSEGQRKSTFDIYRERLEVKISLYSGGRLRTSPSFGFTVTENSNIYASLKEHSVVQREHHLRSDEILLEGRVARGANGEMRVFFHTLSMPTYQFADEADWNTFKRAAVDKMKEKIDPDVVWTLVQAG